MASIMKRVAWLLLLSCLFAFPAFADDDKDHPHHEDLTPTQLGTVHFPISCAASVQKPFARGVALLHSFWYEEAEKEFLQIAKDDPTCAMAHWGIAMSIWHQLWNQPDAATIKRGQAEVKEAKALHPGTPREREFDARADAYSRAMAVAYQRYPEDREAAAFYALSLLASEPDEDPSLAN